jgi:hypothetical protein
MSKYNSTHSKELRRDHVSSPREWTADPNAVRDLCQCFGYPSITPLNPPPGPLPRDGVFGFSEHPKQEGTF